MLQYMQRRALKLVKGAENKAYKEQPWELGFSVDNSRLRETSFLSTTTLKEAVIRRVSISFLR